MTPETLLRWHRARLLVEALVWLLHDYANHYGEEVLIGGTIGDEMRLERDLVIYGTHDADVEYNLDRQMVDRFEEIVICGPEPENTPFFIGDERVGQHREWRRQMRSHKDPRLLTLAHGSKRPPFQASPAGRPFR